MYLYPHVVCCIMSRLVIHVKSEDLVELDRVALKLGYTTGEANRPNRSKLVRIALGKFLEECEM